MADVWETFTDYLNSIKLISASRGTVGKGTDFEL